MKKKIINLLMLTTLAITSFFTAGCELFSVEDDGDDTVTLEDLKAIAKSSDLEEEYTIQRSYSVKNQNNPENEYTSVITHYKNEFGVFDYYYEGDPERNHYTSMTKDFDGAYSGYVWSENLLGIDGLGTLTSEVFSERYGNLSTSIRNFVSSSKLPSEDKMVKEGTYTRAITTNNNLHVLTIEAKDYYLEWDESWHPEYVEIDCTLEITFDSSHVKKVVLNYIATGKDKLSDNTFATDDEYIFECKDTYDISYSVTSQKLDDIVKLAYLIDVVAESADEYEYTVDIDATLEKVSGYDSDNGEITELSIKKTHGNPGYFVAGVDNEDMYIPSYILHREKDGLYICGNSWCDGILHDPDNYTSLGDDALPLIYRYLHNMDSASEKFFEYSIYGLINEYNSILTYDYSIEYDFSKISNNNILTLTMGEAVTDEGSAKWKRSGTLKFVYDDSRLKEVTISFIEKEVTKNNNNYVEVTNGKVRKYTAVHEITYEYDPSVLNSLPAEYR